MGKRQSARHQSGTQWRRVNRRALRLAAFTFLLPVPAALAAPQAATLPTEQLVAMSQVPVRGVGDTVLPRVLPLDSKKSAPAGPAASLTRLERSRQARAKASDIAANGIPAAALRAYRTAEATMSVADPGCRLPWQLLAGIGRIESDHGRYAGAVLGADGVSTPHILGLPLNGAGPVAAIADTDNGALDGDTRWDRAVGPMQFIPSTWAMVGVDGDGDGTRDPHDLDDAALAAGAYLCVGEHDLSTPTGVQQAVFSYNHSTDYVALVLGVAHAYATGAVDLPLLTATLQLPTGTGTTVDLTQGRGLPIGATDDVSPRGTGGKAQHDPAGKNNRADRAEDRAGDDPRDRSTKDEKQADRRRSNDDGSEETGGTNSPRQRSGDRPEGNDTQAPASGDDDSSGPKGGSGGGGDDTVEEPKAPDTPENEAPEEPKAPEETEEPEAPEEPEVEEPDLSEQDQTAEGVLEDCDGSLCLVDAGSGATIAVLPYEVPDYQDLIDGQVPVIVVYDIDEDGETWENIEQPVAKQD